MTDTNDAVAGHAPRGEHERRYLAEVQRRLAHVPPGRRRELLNRLARVRAQRMGPEASTERPDRLPTLAFSPDDWLDVELDHRFVNCSRYATGSSTPFDTVWVTYRIDDRERTTAVDLRTTYSVVSPSDADCPLPRDDGNGG